MYVGGYFCKSWDFLFCSWSRGSQGEWLWVWEGTRGRKTDTVMGDGFLGNAPTQKEENAEKRKTQSRDCTGTVQYIYIYGNALNMAER